MPKLEYQMCYGVESLTISEVCQLWTETLLHSSTVSYIGKVFLSRFFYNDNGYVPPTGLSGAKGITLWPFRFSAWLPRKWQT